MTSISKITDIDLTKLRSQKRSFVLQHFLFTAFATVISLLAGVFAIKSLGYWNGVLFAFSLVSILYVLSFLKSFVAYRKDLVRREKFCALITVIKKSDPKNDLIFFTDSPDIKKIQVHSTEEFAKIKVGNKLIVEVSKYSNCLLRLEKDGISLLNGH